MPLDGKELIWVSKEFAEKYKKMQSENAKIDEQVKVLDEYMAQVSEASKNDFKVNLENLEEEVAIYTGLMLKVKQAFGKAKDESLNASYALWEKFEDEKPRIGKKIDQLINILDPLEKKLNSINDLIGKIRTYNIDRLIESIQKLTCLHSEGKEMFEFLVKNFSKE